MSRYIDADKFYASQVARCGGQPLIGTCTNDNVSLYDELQKFTTFGCVKGAHCRDCENCLCLNDRYLCKRDVRTFLRLRRKER